MQDRKLAAELNHHARIARSANESYVRGKKRFWESALSAIIRHAGHKPKGPIVEIGNGPFGAFLALDGHAEMYCIDPLNEEYLKLFPHLNSTKTVTFISGRAEGNYRLPLANTVICFNALDHIDEPEKAIENMLGLSSENALFVVGVDYYPSAILKSIMHAFRRQIDLPHPVHFTLAGLKSLLNRHFEDIRAVPVDEFGSFAESLPENGGGDGGAVNSGILYSMAGAAYRVAYSLGKSIGMGGSAPNLGIKKMAIFIMRKRKSARNGYGIR